MASDDFCFFAHLTEYIKQFCPVGKCGVAIAHVCLALR